MKGKGSVFITALIGALIGSMITMLGLPTIMTVVNSKGEAIGGSSTQKVINITGENSQENMYKAVIEKAMPSVVGVTTVVEKVDNFFGISSQASGIGTGLVVDSRGYILTNSHVVDDGKAKDVTVLLYDGSKESGEVLWNDPNVDLAILKVNRTGLQAAELADSDKVEIGDTSIAIGNPLGLEFERTVTEGIVSGLDRSLNVEGNILMEGLIQTSAAINPGNSGGPLLNSKGQVIGINTIKAKSGEGLGFAIPINSAKSIVNQFKENGHFEKVMLGIQGINVDYYTQMTGVDMGVKKGVYVAKVESNSVAEKAGIQQNDVILKLGEKEVDTMSALIRELYQYSKGDKTKIEIYRNGKKTSMEINF
ncbi:MAG: serine protease HtrA [Filifactoraceae bacterium]